MTRLAYYLASSGFGGAERYLLTLLRHLDRRRFEPVVYFACTDAEGGARMRQELLRLGVEAREPLTGSSLAAREAAAASAPIARPSSGGPGMLKRPLLRLMPQSVKDAWHVWQEVRRAATVLRREAFARLHCLHGWYPSLEVVMIAGRLAGIPVRLADVQSEPVDIRGWRRLDRWFARLAGRSATRVRAMSERMKAQLVSRCGVPAARIQVVFSGIEIEPFLHSAGSDEVRHRLGLPTECRLVTTVARLSPEKGHEVLLEAIRRLRARQPRVRYLLAGDGPLRETLRTLIRDGGLADRVILLGERSDVPDLLGASDLVVIPSLVEGLPWTLLEAMAAGKPVIATSAGYIPELLVDGEMGRVVPPGNATALARALDELLSLDAPALARLGEAARRRIQRHGSAQQMLEGLAELMEAAGARG